VAIGKGIEIRIRGSWYEAMIRCLRLDRRTSKLRKRVVSQPGGIVKSSERKCRGTDVRLELQ